MRKLRVKNKESMQLVKKKINDIAQKGLNKFKIKRKNQKILINRNKNKKQFVILDENIIEHKYGDLQWTRSWWYGNNGDAVRVCLYSNVELWIGWRVDQVGKTASCNVTYTPCTLIITNDTKKHMPFLYWLFLFRSSLELKTGLKK